MYPNWFVYSPPQGVQPQSGYIYQDPNVQPRFAVPGQYFIQPAPPHCNTASTGISTWFAWPASTSVSAPNWTVSNAIWLVLCPCSKCNTTGRRTKFNTITEPSNKCQSTCPHYFHSSYNTHISNFDTNVKYVCNLSNRS